MLRTMLSFKGRYTCSLLFGSFLLKDVRCSFGGETDPLCCKTSSAHESSKETFYIQLCLILSLNL